MMTTLMKKRKIIRDQSNLHNAVNSIDKTYCYKLKKERKQKNDGQNRNINKDK